MEGVEERIKSEISVTKSTIAIKKSELEKLEKELDLLKKRPKLSSEDLKLISDVLKRVKKHSLDLSQNIYQLTGGKERFVRGIKQQCCHVTVYFNRHKCDTYVVTPGTTCEGLVYQILLCCFPKNRIWKDDVDQIQLETFIRLKRNGSSNAEIKKTRRNEISPSQAFFHDPLYTLVYNRATRPGLWDPEDLLSESMYLDTDDRIRERDAIEFLTEVSNDVNKGYGMNGKHPLPLGKNSLVMLPCLYLVRKEKEKAFDRYEQQDDEEEQQNNNNVQYLEDKNPSSSLAIDVNALRLRNKQMTIGSPLPQNLTLHLPRCSAFEAFIALIIRGRLTETDQPSTTSTTQQQQQHFMTLMEKEKAKTTRSLEMASNIVDFAWLGNSSEVLTLSCGMFIRALHTVNRDDVVIQWKDIFVGIVSGTSDRAIHQVNFKQFESRYEKWTSTDPNFVKTPCVRDFGYGILIDRLVNDLKTDLSDTFVKRERRIPRFVWNRRIRTIPLIIAFIFILLVSLSVSNTFVSIGATMPPPFIGNSIEEMYSWSQNVFCGRLASTDISSLPTTRQISISNLNTSCGIVFPDYQAELVNKAGLSSSLSEWISQYQEEISQVTSLAGSFGYYDKGGYELVNHSLVISTGLDISTRLVTIDFDVVNLALKANCHVQYSTEVDSSGAIVSRYVLGQRDIEMTSAYPLAAVIVLAISIGIPLFFWIYACICRRRRSQSTLTTDTKKKRDEAIVEERSERMEIISLNFIASLIAFGCMIPFLFEYSTNYVIVSILTVCYAMSVTLLLSDNYSSLFTEVFVANFIPLLCSLTLFVILVVGYSIAAEGWNSHPSYSILYFGETLLIMSIAGVIPKYSVALFPVNYSTFSDFLTVLFGSAFLILSCAIVFGWYATVILGFVKGVGEKRKQSSWGFLYVFKRPLIESKIALTED